jgi:hypothetical protein
MKISVASILAVTLVLPAVAAETPPPPTPVMRDVATHDQIVEAARKAREENPMPVFKPAEGADPTVITRPQSLIARSDILSFQGRSTLVPKRALIHVPKGMADRLGMKDGHQIGSWLDFLNANRGWIRTVPVTRVQAEGREPLSEDTIKSFEKEKRLVVATYQDGPISVMPLKVPPPPPADPSGNPAPVPTASTATAATP